MVISSKSNSPTQRKKTHRANPKHNISIDDGRMEWLKLVILYTTTPKTNGEIWYSEEDLNNAASGYKYKGKYYLGPLPNASGFGPSDGIFPAQRNIENKRKKAVTEAIKKLIGEGYLITNMFDNGSGIQTEHYARNMEKTEDTKDTDFYSLDTQSKFDERSTYDPTKELEKLKMEEQRRSSIPGMAGDWLNGSVRPHFTVGEPPYGFHGGKRKSKTKKNRHR
jgi:hypothetical protein